MTEVERKARRPRGKSAMGEFQSAKDFATASEDARVAADKRKTEALRAARLKREQDARRTPTAVASL